LRNSGRRAVAERLGRGERNAHYRTVALYLLRPLRDGRQG
jgi:hypothetical protein